MLCDSVCLCVCDRTRARECNDACAFCLEVVECLETLLEVCEQQIGTEVVNVKLVQLLLSWKVVASSASAASTYYSTIVILMCQANWCVCVLLLL